MAPGAISKFSAPIYEPERLSKANMLMKKVLVTLLELFAPLVVIRRPVNCTSLSPSLRLWFCVLITVHTK